MGKEGRFFFFLPRCQPRPKNRRRPFGFDAMKLDFLCHTFQVSVFSNFVAVPKSPFGHRLPLVAMCMIQSKCTFLFFLQKRGGGEVGKFFTPLKVPVSHSYVRFLMYRVRFLAARFPSENMRGKTKFSHIWTNL